MSESKTLKLSGDSRWLQKVALKFFNTGLDIIDKNSTIQFPIEDTQSFWMKICESITVPVKKDAEMQPPSF